MGQNYLDAFRAPDLAGIDRAAYSNKLLKNDVARIPQRNQAEDLAIQGNQQALNSGQLENAKGVFGRGVAMIAASPKPREAYAAFLQSSDFQAAGKALGLPLEQFTLTDQDTDDTVRQQATQMAGVFGFGSQDNTPVGVRQFNQMASEGNLSQDERQRAARVSLGLDPRAVDMRERQPPSGYQYTSGEGSDLTYIPGGPADPSGPNLRRNSTALRKEYEDQKVVADYRLVLPVYQRAATAEDTRAGDISIIYALGKIFDPGSVVREGELQLSMQAAPWLQQLVSGAKSQITGQGRLSPDLRAELVRAMKGQVDALRAPYDQERGRYAGYATDFGFDANSVVGPDPAAAYGPQGGGQVDVSKLSDEELLKIINGN